MAITVKIDLGYEFAVKAKAADVFKLLSDVPASVAFFPKVDKLTDLGGGSYQWEMEKVGTAQVNIQTVYASKYTSKWDEAKGTGTVKWTPVKGVGNAQVGGHWKIADQKKSTAIELAIEGTVDVPLPSLRKMVVAPVVEAEFEKLVEEVRRRSLKARRRALSSRGRQGHAGCRPQAASACPCPAATTRGRPRRSADTYSCR